MRLFLFALSNALSDPLMAEDLNNEFQGGIMDPKPTVGRSVHYQSYGTPGGEYKSEPRAAVITEVNTDQVSGPEGEVGLCIFNPTGLLFSRRVPFADKPTPGCWNWPPRV